MTLERVTRTYLGLPDQNAIRDRLGGPIWQAVGPWAEHALIEPAREMAARPSKHFRAHLVRTGYNLIQPSVRPQDKDQLESVAAAIELLHTGSLIIDDIQDQSPMRRGAASLHRIYGVPGALCAGNWLYFRPLSLIDQLDLPVERRHYGFKLYHEALELAHYGQALDLTIKIEQIERQHIPATCEAIGELKTGAITALSMSLGALIADAPLDLIASVGVFGRKFGTSLQECDDVGSLTSDHADPAKKYEDLLQGKASAVWAYVVRLFPDQIDAFERAVRSIPEDPRPIQEWLKKTDFAPAAFAAIRRSLSDAYTKLESVQGINQDALLYLKLMGDQLIDAYR
jgi:geranylgeranyl pyrophosphate synthase